MAIEEGMTFYESIDPWALRTPDGPAVTDLEHFAVVGIALASEGLGVSVWLIEGAASGVRAFASLLFSILDPLVGIGIGIGLGPIVGGVPRDLPAPTFGAESLRYALLAINGLAIFSVLFFWMAGSTAREDLAGASKAKENRDE